MDWHQEGTLLMIMKRIRGGVGFMGFSFLGIIKEYVAKIFLDVFTNRLSEATVRHVNTPG